MTGGSGLNRFSRVSLRRLFGALLHFSGLRWLPLEYGDKLPPGLCRRLRAYLLHYYQLHPVAAEGWVGLPGLPVRLYCDLADHMVEPLLHAQGEPHEWGEIRHMAVHRQSGDVLFDVGANHGIWGFALASFEPRNARVVFFEALPRLANRLRKSAAANPTLAAEIVECAIGDMDDSLIDFYLPMEQYSGLGSTVLGDVQRRVNFLSENRKLTVLGRSLDSYIEEHQVERLDFVKIDVEGGEDAVLRGALRTFGRLRPRLVMIETAHDSWTTSRMRGFGYCAYRLNASGLPVALTEVPFWGNIFFVVNERADEVGLTSGIDE